MPKLKTETVRATIGSGFATAWVKVDVYVNTSGEFYCPIPDKVLEYFSVGGYGNGSNPAIHCNFNKAQKLCLYCVELDPLLNLLRRALIDVNTPQVTETHVIRFCIKTKVTFALDADGQVFPNATYPGASWQNLRQVALGESAYGMFSNHDGYTLCIGAKALTRVEKRLGSKVVVDYERYYKGASHHGRENPAQKLNSWAGFDLPEDAKEIPYTDEAALFFHSIMLGMAKLCKQIQDATFNEDRLLETISKSLPLGLSFQPEVEE